MEQEQARDSVIRTGGGSKRVRLWYGLWYGALGYSLFVAVLGIVVYIFTNIRARTYPSVDDMPVWLQLLSYWDIVTLLGALIGSATYSILELFSQATETENSQTRRYYFIVYFCGPIIALIVGFFIYQFMAAGEGQIALGGLTIQAEGRQGYMVLGLSVGFLWQTVLTSLLPSLTGRRVGLER